MCGNPPPLTNNDRQTLPMQRISALDVYRGIVMFLVGLRLLELDEVAQHFPNSAVWQFIGFHSSHVPWVGCSLNDLIHPSFCFLTGASLVFSVTGRKAKGESVLRMTLHALWRSLVLIALGIFLRSLHRPVTHWTFDETLTQTGLGYMVVFALAFAGSRVRWATFAVLLTGIWLFYASHSIIPPHAHPQAFNIPAGWKHDFDGFFAHWNHNRNAGWALDCWLLNEFPRQRPYGGFAGGYACINFIPTIGTMILGLFAGTWLQRMPAGATRRFLIMGSLCAGIGLALHLGGICPIVKRLWTPAWVFLSGGMCFLILAGIYQLVDVRKHRRWAFPFLVVGTNSLAMYLMRHTLDGFLSENLQRHLGTRVFDVFGTELRPAMVGAASLTILWLVLLGLYRRKVFLRI